MRSKDHASEPLLHHDHDKSLSGLRANFITMCLAFSANHACVVSCLAYASAQLGDELGGYGSGVLYICYALTAFFFSKPIVSMVGPKLGLLLGVGGYCIYVAGFLVAVIFRPVAWVVFTIACGMGGIAGSAIFCRLLTIFILIQVACCGLHRGDTLARMPFCTLWREASLYLL